MIQAAGGNIDDGAGYGLFAPDGTIIDYNQGATRMFMVPRNVDLRGTSVLRLCARPDRFHEMVRALRVSGQLQNWDGAFMRFDGAPLHVVANLVGNFDALGVLVSIRVHFFNITEWRLGHERMLLGRRAEAVGQLAGGLAHDFNNLFTVISGHADRLMNAFGMEDQARRSAAAIHEAAARALRLTRQLLAFGRRLMLQPEPINPNELVREVERELRVRFGPRVVVTVALDPYVPFVFVDPSQLAASFVEIATSRADAIPDGGMLTLRSSCRQYGEERLPSQAFVQPGRYVQIEISDTGVSMDGDTQLRLFEPFHAWAQRSDQSGLGLAAVFGVVKQSGGYIWVDGLRPSGAQFTILLPVYEADDRPSGCVGLQNVV
jgi:two-component system, cell cycle sensor histidine kinase and response regulator CckA